MASTTLALQTATITTSLVSAGGIATLSLFDIPELRAQPASRSLPAVRWLFSRGSHIFPAAAALATAGFAYLAIAAHPGAASEIINVAANRPKVDLYLAAAALNSGVGFFTVLAMGPTNFAIIGLNERLGGARSSKAADQKPYDAGERNAEDSVSGKGEATSQFKDLSGPQEGTDHKSTPEQDREADELLAKFTMLNTIRSLFGGVGGVVGLVAALL